MVDIKHIPTIHVFLWAIYQCQGMLFGTGTILGQGILFVQLLTGIYFAYYVNAHYKMSSYIRAVNILVALLSIYAVYYIILDDTVYQTVGDMVTSNKSLSIKSALTSFLPIYVFYWGAYNGFINEKYVKCFLFFWFCVSLVTYINYQQSTAALIYSLTGSDAGEFTNNMGTEFIALIPILCVVKLPNRVKLVFAIIAMMFVFSSFKRGSILVGVILLLMFIAHTLKSEPRKWKIFYVLAIIILLIILSYYVYGIFQSSDYMQSRWEKTLEGDSSGRDEGYSTILQYLIQDASIIHLFFGSGTDSTLGILGNWAHNDWLEIAVCQGLLGVMIFIRYFMGLWDDYRECVDENIRIALLMIFVMFVFKSIFSMSYPGISTSFLLGYCLANRGQL